MPIYYYYYFLLLFFSSSSSLNVSWSRSSSCCLALSPLIIRGGGDEGAGGGIPRRHRRRHRHRQVPVGSGVLDGRQPREASGGGDNFSSRLRTGRPFFSSSSSSSHARPVITTHLSMVDGDVDPMQPQLSPPQPQTEWTKNSVAFFPSPDIDSHDPSTVTQWEISSPSVAPSRPRIVVFGASGRIGRRVLSRLLSSGKEIDVVAFVRDRERLERAMYDDEDIVVGNLVDGGGRGREDTGPRLRIVVGDAVSRRDVCPKKKRRKENFPSLRRWWADWVWRRADRDNKGDNVGSTADVMDGNAIEREEDEDMDDNALRDAMSGATVLISCLGTHRLTNFWTDYLRVPVLRIFRGEDVGRWCADPTHPYYINYLSTRRILEGAEIEQRRRNAIIEFEREKEMLEERLSRGRVRAREKDDGEEGFENDIAAGLRKKRNRVLHGDQRERNHDHANLRDAVALPKDGKLPSSNDRVKFIRISHLMVGRSPFRIKNCLTNTLWSQVSRFELMGEMLMEESTLVDTIVLRPGDMTDKERNRNNTSLQLSVDGMVPSPSLIGRDDVADLAVVTAMTKTSSRRNTLQVDAGDSGSIISGDMEALPNQSAHHWTWAMRWTGQHLIPPQGLRPDGSADAATCFVVAVKEQTALERKRRSREKYFESYHGGRELMRLTRMRPRIKPFIQSLAVSIPVYLTLGIFSWYLFGQTFVDLFARLKRLNMLKL
ncbi:hypothetical protein ACHAXA_009717 [Cyclostephanos tholiformis]|uniref:NAD(P)-binding domain-containing protein n=1 Tax=Cyclostephanos tholiformis TaxID=382380 RepID=A0ABD3RV36_9STRA